MQNDLDRVVTHASKGDRVAFAELYEQLAPRIYSYFYHHLRGHAATAEDLTEDVFLNVLRGLEEYSQRGLPFSAWIYRVAHNRLVDHFRVQARRPQVSLEGAGDPADLEPMRHLDQVLDRQELVAALDRLTPDQREVIVLRFLQRLSIQDAARALDRSEETVRKLQRRALDSLRRMMLHPRLQIAV